MLPTNQAIDVNEQYEKELSELDKIIGELDDLYNETKSHFDSIKNSRIKNSLMFIQGQTSNLIQLKNSKFGVIKEKVSIRKSQADLTIKQTKAENEGQKDEKMVRQIMAEMIRTDDKFNKDRVVEVDDEDDDEDIDSILESKLKEHQDSGKLEFTENDLRAGREEEEDDEDTEGEKELVDAKICVFINKKKKWKFVAVDEMDNIVPDYPVPDKKDHKIRLVKDNGELLAIDQDDKIFPTMRE